MRLPSTHWSKSSEITKTVRGLGHGIHEESVRDGVIQPREEKVSRDPFAIFRGLMGDYREDGPRVFSEGHQKRMSQQRHCSKGKFSLNILGITFSAEGIHPWTHSSLNWALQPCATLQNSEVGLALFGRLHHRPSETPPLLNDSVSYGRWKRD